MSLTAYESWFSTLGEPLGPGEATDIAAYLAGFALSPKEPTLLVDSWQAANTIIRRPAQLWWEAEEAERARLERTVHLNPADPAWIALNDALHGAAAIAAARAGCADPGLIKAAAGSASYSAYQSRLAAAAGASADHPFRRKYALFVGGRWPLGLYDDRYAIF